MKKVDFIIVGLGLAGACLALQCRRRGRKALVFDCPAQNRASVVAPGLFSPVTGIKMVKTWKADTLFPYLHRFYTEMESVLGNRFFHSLPCYIPFLTAGEQNEWLCRSSHPDYEKYIIAVHTTPRKGSHFYNALGGVQLSNCGYVSTRIFLDTTREMLRSAGLYFEERLDEKKLKINRDGVGYGDVEARKIIFCTGADILSGSYFSGLPVSPLKGEIIHIDTGFAVTQIYKRGVYICGVDRSTCVVGSTYDREDLSMGTTERGKKELVEKAKKMLVMPFEVTRHDWGMRLVTIDRRPLVGEHPSFKNVLVFNGLGTKGVSLAPWLSDRVARLLDGEINLEKDIGIGRMQRSP